MARSSSGSPSSRKRKHEQPPSGPQRPPYTIWLALAAALLAPWLAATHDLAFASSLAPALVSITLGLAMLLIAFNNLTDYNTNFALVQHVLAMDAIALPDITTRWRGINSATLGDGADAVHHAAYALIISAEAAVGTLCLVGGSKQLLYQIGMAILNVPDPYQKHLGSPGVQMSMVGLELGFVLFFLGFVVVGSEWFYMWGSETWNGQIKAFHWSTIFLLAILLHRR